MSEGLLNKYTMIKQDLEIQTMLDNGAKLKNDHQIVYTLVVNQMQNYINEVDGNDTECVQIATYDEIREALLLPDGIIQRYSNAYKTMYYAKYECVLHDEEHPDWIQVNIAIAYNIDAFDNCDDYDECFYGSTSIMTERRRFQIRNTIT